MKPPRVTTIALALLCGVAAVGCSSDDHTDSEAATLADAHSKASDESPTTAHRGTPAVGVALSEITATTTLTSLPINFSKITSREGLSGVEISDDWILAWHAGVVRAAHLTNAHVRGYGDEDSPWVVREATAAQNALYVREYIPDSTKERIVEVLHNGSTRVLVANDGGKPLRLDMAVHDDDFYYFAAERTAHKTSRVCANSARESELTCIEAAGLDYASPALDGVSLRVELSDEVAPADAPVGECYAPGFFTPMSFTLSMTDINECGSHAAATSHSAVWSLKPPKEAGFDGYTAGRYWLGGRESKIEDMAISSPLSCYSRLTFKQRYGSSERHVWLHSDGTAEVIKPLVNADVESSNLLCADDGRWVLKTKDAYYIEGSAPDMSDELAKDTHQVPTHAQPTHGDTAGENTAG